MSVCQLPERLRYPLCANCDDNTPASCVDGKDDSRGILQRKMQLLNAIGLSFCNRSYKERKRRNEMFGMKWYSEEEEGFVVCRMELSPSHKVGKMPCLW